MRAGLNLGTTRALFARVRAEWPFVDRDNRGFVMDDFCDRLGVNKSTGSRWEDGSYEAPLCVVAELADYLVKREGREPHVVARVVYGVDLSRLGFEASPIDRSGEPREVATRRYIRKALDVIAWGTDALADGSVNDAEMEVGAELSEDLDVDGAKFRAHRPVERQVRLVRGRA